MKYDISIQDPDNRGAILRLVQRTAILSSPHCVTGFFAYATAKGVELLAETLARSVPDWDSVRKRWIVAIDFGHTDPDAIRILRRLRNSQVRIPFAQEVLSRRLRPVFAVHGKTLILHRNRRIDRAAGGIVVSSANMTFSGLCFGFEHAAGFNWQTRHDLSASGCLERVNQAYARIESTFTDAFTPTESFIRRYAEVRPMRIRRTEDDSDQVQKVVTPRSDLALYENAVLATAKNLWADVDYVVPNRGRGRPGNQIDLPRGSRVFFGFDAKRVPKNTVLGAVALRHSGGQSTCHMRFGDNSMDKLNLPVPEDLGLPAYEHNSLLFTREANGTYSMVVQRSSRRAGWRAKSIEQGTLLQMRGGRQYGVFS